MAAHDCRTGTSDLLASLADGVLTLTLNRPEARNAFAFELIDALAAQLAMAELADDVRCIVLTGAGKGFSAGGDIKAMERDQAALEANPDAFIRRQRIAQRETAGRIFRMAKPTLAVINGAAAGAGLSLALACDLRLMAEDAFMTTAFGGVGLSGDFGGTWFMTQLVGAARARQFYMLPDRISAAEAVSVGLANWSCPSADLAARSAEIAGRLARGPSVALGYMKENLNRAMIAEFEDCMDLEATHHVHCMFTQDHHDAVANFVRGKS